LWGFLAFKKADILYCVPQITLSKEVATITPVFGDTPASPDFTHVPRDRSLRFLSQRASDAVRAGLIVGSSLTRAKAAKQPQ
jgi:hypothetical protein